MKGEGMVNLQGEDLQEKFNVARIIYMVIMATLVVYTYVAILVNNGPYVGDNQEFPPSLNIFKYILYGLSFIMFFIINFIRQTILYGKNQPKNVTHTSKGSKFLILTIVTAALCESVLIYGLILFFVGKQIKDFYFLALVSLVYFLNFFPKYSQWEEWAKQ